MTTCRNGMPSEESGQQFVVRHPCLYSLAIAAQDNPGSFADISIILEKNLFPRYVTNIDELRIFVRIFSKYAKLIYDYFISELEIFASIITDIDAFKSSFDIFSSIQEKDGLVTTLLLVPSIFRMVIENQEALRIAERYAGSQRLEAAFIVYNKSFNEILAMLNVNPNQDMMDLFKEYLILKTKSNLLSTSEFQIICTLCAQYQHTSLMHYLQSLASEIKANMPRKLYDQTLNFFAPQQNLTSKAVSGCPKEIKDEMTRRQLFVNAETRAALV